MSPSDVQATFCATLVDEWIEAGLTHAVIAPGSRSTPMAIALTDRSEVCIHVVLDERVAGFVALGLGISGTPALLLCTSGTAAANFFPAVVEAGLSDVPMIVLTADRPVELRNVGAPQTIDQIELYGQHVRWFLDPGVAAADDAAQWRGIAQQAARNAADGPVQLNLAFREPLLGTAGELPAPSPSSFQESPGQSIRRVATQPVPTAVAEAVGRRGLILVGGRSGVDRSGVEALHSATGWPVVADPISAMRDLDGAISTVDSLLRHPAFADGHRPAAVIRIGRPSASKMLAQWIDGCVRDHGAVLVQVGGPGVVDPAHNVSARCSIDDVLLAVAQTGAHADQGWSHEWSSADAAADRAVAETIAAGHRRGELTEPGVARLVADHLPPGVELVVASSMPIRDHEWFGGPRAVAHANRGANGIDGVMSTALGLALSAGSAAVLIGDLAFLHDSNALLGLVARGVDLRIVVVDNDGGGIFSFLPQAERLTTERFEQLFGTPVGADLLAVASAHGIPVHQIADATELVSLLDQRGPWVARIASDRERNVADHAALHAAVAAAIS